MLADIIEKPTKNRSAFLIKELIPLVKPLPFFKERGLKDTSIQETISLMEYKQVRKDEFVIEYGTFGDEFYVVLEGECEVLVPDNNCFESFRHVNRELKVLLEELEKTQEELRSVEAYKEQVLNKQKID